MDWIRAAGNRWFRWVLDNQLIYPSCWEDPRVDRQALRITDRDTVLAIASGGCNVLAYALDAPRRIHAVDINPRQTALLELKLAGIAALDFETFFCLFGRGYLPRAVPLYRRLLRERLSAPARHYWDRNVWKFADRRRPFYDRGGIGTGSWLFRLYAHRIACLQPALERLFAAGSVEEQARIYREELRPGFWTPAARRCLNHRFVLAAAGVPDAQRRHARETIPDVASHLDQCAERVLSRVPLADNYFWQLYIHGRYTRSCCPDYLKPDNFQRLKEGLARRISVHTSSLDEFLRSTTASISRFALLDHLDWLAGESPERLAAAWQNLLRRAAPGARFVWRSMGSGTGWLDACGVEHHGRLQRLGEVLSYETELASALQQRERVNTYSSLYVATLGG